MTAKSKILVSVLLVSTTIVAYLPAMRAGFIWDDPDHIVHNPILQSMDGLRQMWTDRHSLPQWYPLTHTTLWIEYGIWGDHPTGYHVVNVLVHATNAVLLWRLLSMLNIPGALLAAAIWALHPVNVESVAWITERKNVLSTMFYLLAFIAYLRAFSPDENANWKSYVSALVLFVAALLSKTVTCSLPAAILLVIWWKAGRLRWRDIWPTIPFFAIGILLAMNTAQLEQVRVGATGDEWRYADSRIGDLLSRCIIAGKALWFYAWTLVWPVNLAFVYERWTIDWRDGWQYAYPVSFLATMIALFNFRNRIGRGPLVAVLLFAGTLVPALGFFNVFPHRYAFAADHFQYVASIGLLALAGAVLARFGTAAYLVPAVLGVLTFRQCLIYHSAETLWTDTVRKSPNNWMTWTNLGNALVAEKRYDEAIPLYEKALLLAPDVDDLHYNAGHAAARRGRFRDAEKHFREAVRIKPTYLPAWESLGDLYADELNEPEKAIEAYQRALDIAPNFTRPQQKIDQLRQRMRAREGEAPAEPRAPG